MLTVVFRNFGKHSSLSGELFSVKVKINDKQIDLTALVDTGNTLQDPLSGTAVMVVEGMRMSSFFQKKLTPAMLEAPTNFLSENQEYPNRFRLLPYQVVGMQGILLVMKVDSILVNGKEIRENLVAFSPTALSDGGGYHALLPGTFAYCSKTSLK